MKKKTIEEIKPAIELGNEYELLSKIYINDPSKLEILHKFCGYVFWMSWNGFKRGHRCPKCSGILKLTIEYVKPAIELGNEYELLSDEYINNKTELEILHKSCGDVFWMSYANFSHGRRCPKCWFKNNRGENHGSWNPNLTDEERKNKRYSIEYIKWRKAVLEHDKDTCQKCKVKGGKLVAHHILPYALFKELRFEVENGITLCETCHDRYHKVWGHDEGCNSKTMKTHLLYNHDL